MIDVAKPNADQGDNIGGVLLPLGSQLTMGLTFGLASGYALNKFGKLAWVNVNMQIYIYILTYL